MIPLYQIIQNALRGFTGFSQTGSTAIGTPDNATEGTGEYEAFDNASPVRHAFISRALFRGPVAAPMRVGVIGVGSMGQNHARGYSEIADLVGIADPDVKAGGAASNRVKVPYDTDSAPLVKQGLDAGSACVPTEHHTTVALAVVKAGVSVPVE